MVQLTLSIASSAWTSAPGCHLDPVVIDEVNGNFYARFLEGGIWVVRVGSLGVSTLYEGEVKIDLSGNLVVAVPAERNDDITIVLDGANYRVTDRINRLRADSGTVQDGPHDVLVPIVNVTGAILVDSGDGHDKLTLDMRNGNPVPTGGLMYDGGDPLVAPGGDSLSIVGDGIASTAVYTPDGVVPGDGTVVVSDTVTTSTISFTGLEPVDIRGMATATVRTPGADDTLTIDDSVYQAIVISGTSGGTAIESARLFDNTHVIVDTDAVAPGNDTITITSAGRAHLNENLTIDTGSGTDQIVLAGDVRYVRQPTLHRPGQTHRRRRALWCGHRHQ